MLSEIIRSAKAGRPIWMPELRERFLQDPAATHVVFHLQLISGEWQARDCAVPQWDGEEEATFVREFFYACIYNLLSVCSGRELRFEYNLREERITALISSLDEVFQVREAHRRGYGKVISIANRLCSAFGLPPFSFGIGPAPAEASVSGPAVSSHPGSAHSADDLSGVICGIDIGGSDIKFAVAVDGKLAVVREYDWNPASSPTAEGILQPILAQVEELRADLPGRPLFDAIGVSFPDIVINDRILGGETPKTDGMRRNPELNYEEEFRKIGALKELLLKQCRPGAAVRIINDGNMAAFTATEELSRNGLVAHTLGTDLGTGWVLPDGSIPQLPLELYDVILDLGNDPARKLPPQDLRSTRNENSGLPGARRYLGQSAAFRVAWALDPSLLDGFTEEHSGVLFVPTQPEDLRKPCLQHLMQKADTGIPSAQEVFRRIGCHLGIVCREMDFLLRPQTRDRYLYGRFLKSERCFRLMQDGCAETAPGFTLFAPDENAAQTPLMRELAARRDVTVAQFGQTVGAIHYAAKTLPGHPVSS